MNIKELLTHVNDNVQNDRNPGSGLLWKKDKTHSLDMFDISWHDPQEYSLAPKMVLVNGIECVAGMTEAPMLDTPYLVVDVTYPLLHTRSSWDGISVDCERLKNGILFPDTNEGTENVKAMGRAMISFGEVE